MNSDTNNNKKVCNCRNKDDCPLDGKGLVECIFYKAAVFTTNQTNTYFSLAEGDFKGRCNNHSLK